MQPCIDNLVIWLFHVLDIFHIWQLCISHMHLAHHLSITICMSVYLLYASTYIALQLIILGKYFVLTQINVGCGYNTATTGAVSLEFYYLDSDELWAPVISPCDVNDQCTNDHEETIYYSINYGGWTRVTVVISEDDSTRSVNISA